MIIKEVKTGTTIIRLYVRNNSNHKVIIKTIQIRKLSNNNEGTININKKDAIEKDLQFKDNPSKINIVTITYTKYGENKIYKKRLLLWKP